LGGLWALEWAWHSAEKNLRCVRSSGIVNLALIYINEQLLKELYLIFKVAMRMKKT